MAQAGIHAFVSIGAGRWVAKRTGIMLGLVLGSLIPDADNLAVAVATVIKQPTLGIHRTATHSLFFALLLLIIFYVVGILIKKPYISYLGIGLGIGVTLHSLLDLILWYSGVAILWPLPVWINFWQGINPPEWLDKLFNPLELFFFSLFFIMLAIPIRSADPNRKSLNMLWACAGIEGVLFIIFTFLAFTLRSGFLTIYGLVYLLSLGLAIGVSIQMREILEQFGGNELALRRVRSQLSR